MSQRFGAEALIRAAASGAFPVDGDILLRTPNGWVFAQASETTSVIEFTEIIGIVDKSQLPPSVAYEDEANVFGPTQKFEGTVLVDIINECTLDAGVTIEGVLLKDGEIETAKKALQLDDVGGTPIIRYLGKAAPGALLASAVWSIQRITEQTDGDISVQWADGDSAEDNIWDNRLALSYS